MIRLLFTGGGGAGNEALYRLLQGRYDVHFADADPLAISPSIPADRRHAIPFANASDFGERLGALIEKLRIDLLVPGVDEELPLLADLAAHCAGRILLPPADFVNVMTDKLHTIQALSARHIATPRTVTAAHACEIDFPCIVKPRHGRGSRGVRLLTARPQLESYLQLEGGAPDKFVLQEHLIGNEYTVMMAADCAGRLRAVVPVRVALKRGITIRAETTATPEVIAACAAIHHVWPASGCFNIQLILTDDGRALPFEINPRVSTTLCLALAAGVDPFSIFLSESESPSDLLAFDVGIALQRHWTNIFSNIQGMS
jgi:carbamoyl-phosphate synthase large subunit